MSNLGYIVRLILEFPLFALIALTVSIGTGIIGLWRIITNITPVHD